MLIDDVISKKTISVNDIYAERCTDREFHELPKKLYKILVSERGYKEVAFAVKEGTLLLLNCPSANQRLPTLDEGRPRISLK